MTQSIDGDGSAAGVAQSHRSNYRKLQGVAARDVSLSSGFWAARYGQLADVTLPFLMELAADPAHGHALSNFRIAAGLEAGEFTGTHWQDEWVYKWIEAASYVVAQRPDGELLRQIEEVVALIEAAQEPDGYIATQIQVRGWTRFQAVQHHELYVMGHLLTAAAVNYTHTGSCRLLEIARRAAEYLCDTFLVCPPSLVNFGFNPSYIMGLVDLYRVTNVDRYLELASAFVDRRGTHPAQNFTTDPAGTDQTQSRVALRDERQAVGHMVTGTYLWAGAADVFMETGDKTLIAALERIWNDVTGAKMYVTGGVAPMEAGLSLRGDIVSESTQAAYFLPNSTAYNETCAQIGLFMWSARMLAITGAARYADVMERALYNSILSGIGLEGKSWFYTNLLRWHGADHAPPSISWPGMDSPGEPRHLANRATPGRSKICCPTNLARTLAGIQQHLFSTTESGVQVNLFAASTLDTRLATGEILKMRQETDYPWKGVVRLVLDEVPHGEFSIDVRIPQWADEATVMINGSASMAAARAGTYWTTRRQWQSGDTVELRLPMRVRLLEAHPAIEAARNQVAVARGPLVYALESQDLPTGVAVDDVRIRPGTNWRLIPGGERLQGITLLSADVDVVETDPWDDGDLYRELGSARQSPQRITLIPYFAWCNRGPGEMAVWLLRGHDQASVP